MVFSIPPETLGAFPDEEVAQTSPGRPPGGCRGVPLFLRENDWKDAIHLVDL